MPVREVLILAMTKMLSGICTAGFACEEDAPTHLCWVRPVREFDTLRPGDMTGEDGELLQCSDVIELYLVDPRPDPPHVEDWLADFVHHRPRVIRRLEGEKRAQFFPKYLDDTPEEVLRDCTRSLCLVHPQEVWARFSLDPHSGRFQARMGFTLQGDYQHPRAQTAYGLAITDLKLRGAARAWLGSEGGRLTLSHEALLERLGAEALYLTLGLSRLYQGEYWPLVHAVHAVPDYIATADAADLH